MTTRRKFVAGTAATTVIASQLTLPARSEEKKENMKALMVNGSPRQNGNTARALREVADAPANGCGSPSSLMKRIEHHGKTECSMHFRRPSQEVNA